MPKPIDESGQPKPRKKRKRTAAPKPPPQEVATEIVEEQIVPDELTRFLAKMNALFDLNVTPEGLERGRDQVIRYYADLQRSTVETDWPILLSTSLEYAKFRIAQRFGLCDDSDTLVAYGSVKSRYIEMVDAAMKGH